MPYFRCYCGGTCHFIDIVGKRKGYHLGESADPRLFAISSMQFSWFSGQTVQGLSFASRDGSLRFQAERWHSEAGFWAFIWTGLNIPKSEFTHLEGQAAGEAFSFDKLELQMHYAYPSFAAELSNEKFHVKGAVRFSEGGILLSEPLVAEWQEMPEISKRLLGRINPIFANALSSQGPVKLVVEPEGTFFPAAFDNIKLIRIPQATFFANSLQFKNSDYWKLLLQSMRSQALLKLPQITIRFSPLRLHLAEGVVSFEKMEALIENTLVVVVWGQVDLNNDQVKMTLGIPAATLLKAFDIKSLPSDYLLQIPMKGSTSQLKVDWTKAATDVAKLLLKQRVS